MEKISNSPPNVTEIEEMKPEVQNNNVAYQPIDPEEERRVVRKLDMVILPLMAFVYFFQYLDKQSINYASVFGLRTDLKMNGFEFSWAISLFYLGQLCSEYPAAYFMSRLPITVFVGVTIVIWGGCEMALGAAQNFRGLAAARFFLGFAEATVSPAFIVITSNWYRRREHAIRVAVWVSMSGISQIVGAVLMYLIGRAHFAIQVWRVMFLIAGGMTSLCGIVFLVMMPRDSTTAWFLNAREREVATQRLAMDRATRDKKDFNKQQVKEALTQPITWLYFLMALCITLTTPILKFSSLVISGFGYSKFQTMLVGLPGGAINFTTVWIGALVPRMVPNARIATAIGLTCVPLVGSILLLSLPAHYSWGIVASTWLAACSSALLSCVASLMASNVKGNTKKSVISAGFFISYCVGCIVSPQAWLDPEAPRYVKGCILSIAAWAGLIVTLLVYGGLLRRRNKSRDQKAEDGREEYMIKSFTASGEAVGVSVDSDLTETQDKQFRYSL